MAHPSKANDNAGGVPRLEPQMLGFGRLFDRMPDAIVVADMATGRIVLWNQGATTLFGYPVEEAVGMPFEALVPNEARVHFEQLLARHRTDATPAPETMPARRRSGERIWMALTLTPIVDAGVAGTFMLATIREGIAQGTRVRRCGPADPYEMMVEAQRLAHVGSWQWDMRLDVETGSAELYRIYGLDPDTFEGTLASFERLVHPDDLDMLNRLGAQALRDGLPFTSQHRIRTDAGEEKVIFSRTEVVHDEAGHPIKMIGVSQDVTELTHAVEALARRTEELRRMQELDHLKTNFVHSVSHELRTPLTSILGFAEFL